MKNSYTKKKSDLLRRINEHITKLSASENKVNQRYIQHKISALRLCLDIYHSNNEAGFMSCIVLSFPEYNHKSHLFGDSKTKKLIEEAIELYRTRFVEAKQEKLQGLRDDAHLQLQKNGNGIQYQSKLARGSTGEMVNHNGSYVDERGDEIVCRQLAWYVTATGMLASGKKQKLRRKFFSRVISEDSYFQENHFDNQSKLSERDHCVVVDNDKIGIFIRQLAGNLVDGGSVALDLGSENHLMSLQVEKRRDGSIKIKFYDPNQTYSYKNALFNAAEDVQAFNFKIFLGSSYYKECFPTTTTCVMSWNGGAYGMGSGLLTYNFEEALWHYCFEGCASKIAATLNIITKEQFYDIGLRALCALLCNSAEKTEAINEFVGGLIRNKERLGLNKDKINNLLSMRDHKGESRQINIFSGGKINNIKAYIHAVTHNQDDLGLDSTDVKDILLCGSGNLSSAVTNGYIKCAVEYIKAVKELGLSPEDKKSLIIKESDIKAGFDAAVKSGSADRVEKYIADVLEHKSFLLEESGCSNDKTTLDLLPLAVTNGYIKSAVECIKAVKELGLSSEDEESLIIKESDIKAGFDAAVRSGSADRVEKYIADVLKHKSSLLGESGCSNDKTTLDLLVGPLDQQTGDISSLAKDLVSCLSKPEDPQLVSSIFSKDIESMESNGWKHLRGYLEIFKKNKKLFNNLILLPGKNGSVLLHRLVKWGCTEQVKALIETAETSVKALVKALIETAKKVEGYQFNINEIDIDGKTPLHYAAESGELGIAELLIAGGADVNIEDNDDNTPLDYANGSGNPDMIRHLSGDKNKKEGVVQAFGLCGSFSMEGPRMGEERSKSPKSASNFSCA